MIVQNCGKLSSRTAINCAITLAVSYLYTAGMRGVASPFWENRRNFRLRRVVKWKTEVGSPDGNPTSPTTPSWRLDMAAFPNRPILPFLKADPTIVDRFWGKVRKTGPGECWEWQFSRNKKDYGRFKLAPAEGRHANRVAWAIANDRDPGNLIIRHSCDNPPCCNPAHLLIGTHQDNANDKVQRGRARTSKQDGENNGHAVLTIKQVGQIVQAFRDGLNNQQIAARFPVGHSLVSRIRTGRSWRRQSASFGWDPQRLVAPPPPRLAEIERINAEVRA